MSLKFFELNEYEINKIKCCGEFHVMYFLVMLKKNI